VLYVTERCVFRLTPGGLELVEVAPGIDIDRDILAHMQFAPIIDDPQSMDPRIFSADLMGLRERMLAMPLEQRFAYDPRSGCCSSTSGS
jgi:propionate CoA-transferase